MKGKHEIIIRNRRQSYQISLERNITILTGESATGKTSLTNLIRQYETLGRQSGVTVQADVPCRVLEGPDWELRLGSIHNSIFFTDEGQGFIQSKVFAEAVARSDNYFLLITRENLPELPYSVKSVLELKKTTSRFKRTYTRAYPLYEHLIEPTAAIQTADLILTEDANAGYQFYAFLAEGSDTVCISAQGKSNLPGMLLDHLNSKTIVAADGAAFGPEMRAVWELMKDYSDHIILYLPESFEWVLLKSDILRDPKIQEILQNPAEYIESERYLSWERFFTELLTEKTKGTALQYSKRVLNQAYLLPDHLNRILAVISGTE